MMFAIRFASITLTKQITGARVDPADQFTFEIQSTSSGASLASGTTTGTGNGPFDAAVISTSSGIDVTLTEMMAGGSVSALSAYDARLNCINGNAGSSTVLPVNLATTNYDFGSLDFGDAVECTFTNTAFPHISLEKQLSAEGRIYDTDEFRIRIRQGNGNLRAQTTSGTGATIINGDTGMRRAIAGDPYRVDERARGSTDLSRYTAALTCTNAFAGSATVLPTAQNEVFTPAAGDVISCVILNTRDPATAVLNVNKRSELVSDPLNGASNPFAVPGAVFRYYIEVENRGDAPVDLDTISITDVMPPQIAFDGSSPVVFTEGTTASGLTAFDPSTMVTFSAQPAGVAPFDHTPASGYDLAVRGILIEPGGSLAASDGVNHPGFTISFLAKVE
ncbi:hypothetical protein N8940_00920 [Sphingomonadaceae bacterium]|nr:hypothetical protein [Sphingomonadaceae bacterium]